MPEPFQLQNLNEHQRAAVTCVDGPLLIIAGPGSGKTRVITQRIGHMITECGIAGHEIAALTFTNKAASEMRLRIEQIVPDEYVWTGTFHRFCSRLLRQYSTLVGLQPNFSIYDTSDSIHLIKQAIKISNADNSKYRPETIASEISRAKSACVDAESFSKYATKHVETVAAPVYMAYQQLLADANAADFDDLLLHVVTILKTSPELREQLDERFRYLLVDEYQDTNLAQYAIIRGLSVNHPNLAVTGDPDQSIYSWRGANLANILEFEKDFPGAKLVRLEDNYRSTKSILRVADQLISNNVKRKQKTLRTVNEQGEPVRLVAYGNQRDEAQQIADEIHDWLKDNIYQPDEIAIFYRANWLSRSVEHALRSNGIPYQIVNGYAFYQRREIKDLLCYLHLINNPDNNVALERIINIPPRKIGKTTIERLRDYAAENRIPMLEAARQSGLNSQIRKQAATKVSKFVALYDRISVENSDSVERLLQTIIDETDYLSFLLGDETEEAHERAGNVEELLLSAREFDMQHPDDGGLEAYLEQTALVSDTDAWDASGGAVTLMTLHAAKGLEFPIVFIVGLEEGLIPHERSSVEPDDIEEERRLLFVGATRAKSVLRLSRCMTRFKRGRSWPAIPSRFLMELPRSEMQISEPSGYDYSHFGGTSTPIYDETQHAQDFLGDHYESSFADENQDMETHNDGLAAIQIKSDCNIPDEDEVPFAFDDLLEPEVKAQSKSSEPSPPVTKTAHGASTEAGGKIQTSSSNNSELNDSNLENLAGKLFTASDLMGDIRDKQLHEGQQVFHPTYGKGIIARIEGKEKKQLAEIDFESVGMKKIMTAYCNLVSIS